MTTKTIEQQARELDDKLNKQPIEFEYSGKRGEGEQAIEILNNHTFTPESLLDVVKFVHNELEGDESWMIDLACQDFLEGKGLDLETVTFFIHWKWNENEKQ